MAAITIYKTATGEIVRTVTCPDDHVPIQAQTGESYVDGIPDAFPGIENWYVNITASPPAISLMTQPRPTIWHSWNYSTEAWEVTTDNLAACKAAQSWFIASICAETITAGFTSSALGSAYQYPSAQTDQANLQSTVTASLAPGLSGSWTAQLWCESGGAWSFVLHTAAQVQQVNSDWLVYLNAQQSTNASHQAAIEAAGTVEDVMAITW